MDQNLKRYIGKAEALLEEIFDRSDDLKFLLKEAKEAGYDAAAIRRVATIKLKTSAEKEAARIATLIEYGRSGGVQLELGLVETTADEPTPPTESHPPVAMPIHA